MPPAAFTVELGVAVPAALGRDVLAKIHYVSEDIAAFAFADEERRRLRVELRPGCEGSAAEIGERLRKLAQKMCAAFRDWRPKVLVDRLARPVAFGADPHPLLEASGELWRAGQGRYGLGPLLTGLMASFERSFLELARAFDAAPHQFPALVGADTLERCRYIRSFPHSLNLVSHLREDLDAIQRFAGGAAWDGERLRVAEGTTAGVKCLLSPSVCFHWYAWLHDRVLAAPRAITALGKCFRWESGNLAGLERLWDFTMREIVFTGPRAWVLERRSRAIELTAALLDRWELAYEIQSATDPFFIDDFSAQSAFQVAFDLKFEIRARLPYAGSTLAVGSFNHHQDFFGKSFNIRAAAGAPTDTGCVGFGLERLALAFVAQHGVEPERWPAAARRELERP
jgi:seryl-tRNA synthetase